MRQNYQPIGIAAVAVRRPVTVAMFTLAIILFGFVSLGRLPVNLLPDLSYPTLTVRTAYPGAAPSEIEQLVNRPIEEVLGTVRGIRTITSYARAGQSDVVLEFAWGTRMDMAGLEVREKLDTVLLPIDLEKPIILRFNPNLEPMMRFALNRAQVSSAGQMQEMRRFADEELKRQLEGILGVAAVRVGGGYEDEIQILINELRASQLNIDVATVVSRLRQENLNQASGRIETNTVEFLVRTFNQFQTLQDIENIYVTTRNGAPIQLKDIAAVRSGYKDRTSISRVNGEEAIEINIYREGDANTVRVANEVYRRLPHIQAQLPRDYQLELLSDQSTFIRNAIASVKRNAWFGGFLAMGVIFIFLREIRPTLIISMAIPVSVIATFLFMFVGNLSLNMMSLGGIALAIGLLVDNSIVVLENIARRREQGDDEHDAAINGTQEVSGAIIAATLTTLAVFIPLIFVTGMAGQLFTEQAITVSVALLASLAVALTLIPMLASRKRSTHLQYEQATQSTPLKTLPTRRNVLFWLSWPVRSFLRGLFYWLPVLIFRAVRMTVAGLTRSGRIVTKPLLTSVNRFLEITGRIQQAALQKAQKSPWQYFAGFTLLTCACFLLIPRLDAELIPTIEQREFFVDIELTRGTPIARTDALLTQFAQAFATDPRISLTYSIAGTGSLMQIQANQGGDFWGRIHVVTAPGLSSEGRLQLKDDIRSYLEDLPDVKARIDFPKLVSLEMPLRIEIYGYELERLLPVAAHITDTLNEHPNFRDVRNGLTIGQPELVVHFDHARLAWLGLTPSDVSRLISTHIGGQVATRYQMLDRQIDVRVRLPDDARQNPDILGHLIINPGADVEIPLSAIAEITRSAGPSEITRLSQQRVALITASPATTNIRGAQAELNTILANVELPPGITARSGGQGELLSESYRSMAMALALAIFLVYLVMASQFESFGHPFLIMFSVPLAAAGSVVGLWLTSSSMSVVVFIGLIMLAGIVVNNSIVLIDRINQLRLSGTEKLLAIRMASAQRLRPILMTTLTTVLGLTPLAFGFGEGSELSAGMAIAVMSGLLFATLLTLLFIPLVYQLFDRKQFSEETPNA